MTQVEIDDGRLQVRLTRFEKVAGLLGDLDVPLASVMAAEAVVDGLSALTGIRAPGLAVPGRRIGTWRGRGATRFVAVTSGRPALHVRLRGHRYDEVLVTTPDAEALAGRLSAPSR